MSIWELECPRHGRVTPEIVSVWGTGHRFGEPRCRVPVDDGSVKVKRTRQDGTVTEEYERRVFEFCGLPLTRPDTESSVTRL